MTGEEGCYKVTSREEKMRVHSQTTKENLSFLLAKDL